eukprot:TRINITY_DN7925_c0_g2_i1.p1 TRINITY_DN7925_c0_g2~~TRINITY_DN7925_c0_g2_i1.p1  ORF type:complete len:588 (-),score=107.12 TRINITY_DN7925_c0_g2_i1:64-1827(-)
MCIRDSKSIPTTHVALGEVHTVVLHKNGSLSSCGSNKHNALGSTPRLKPEPTSALIALLPSLFTSTSRVSASPDTVQSSAVAKSTSSTLLSSTGASSSSIAIATPQQTNLLPSQRLVRSVSPSPTPTLSRPPSDSQSSNITVSSSAPHDELSSAFPGIPLRSVVDNNVEEDKTPVSDPFPGVRFHSSTPSAEGGDEVIASGSVDPFPGIPLRSNNLQEDDRDDKEQSNETTEPTTATSTTTPISTISSYFSCLSPSTSLTSPEVFAQDSNNKEATPTANPTKSFLFASLFQASPSSEPSSLVSSSNSNHIPSSLASSSNSYSSSPMELAPSSSPAQRPLYYGFNQIEGALKLKKVISISVGTKHSVCVTDAKEVYSWGDGTCGQLGLGVQRVSEAAPVLVEAALGKYVVSVSCGSDWTSLLTERGDIISFGSNTSGQLGLGDTYLESKVFLPMDVLGLSGKGIVQISCGFDHTIAVDSKGVVYSWGYGANGKLGHNNQESVNLPTVVEKLRGTVISQVSAGAYHSAAISNAGELYMWGWNYYGQLGIGHTGPESQSEPVRVREMENHVVLQVSCGDQHTIALVTSRI